MISTFGPKSRNRKTNKTHWVYGSPPFDEPVLAWNRIIHSKGAFNLLAEGPFDEAIRDDHEGVRCRPASAPQPGSRAEALRRALRCHARDQVDYVGVEQEGERWQTLAYVPMETNYEYVS